MSWWENARLADLDDDQWEALCDGCARCCMVKLEDEDTAEVFYTSVVCRYLDLKAARCTVYPDRHRLVPDCVPFDADAATQFDWLPETCAYRKVARGEPLSWWHPLVSGRRETVVEAGISVLGRVISEDNVPEEDLEEHIVRWIEPESAT